MAVCASWESLMVAMHSAWFSSRSAVSVLWYSLIWLALASFSVICFTRSLIAASISSTFLVIMVFLSVLSSFDSVLVSTSTAHQLALSSSSFCSAMSWKIIFWIICLILSKGPSYVLIAWASFCSFLDLVAAAAFFRRFTAFVFGSSICKNERVVSRLYLAESRSTR